MTPAGASATGRRPRRAGTPLRDFAVRCAVAVGVLALAAVALLIVYTAAQLFALLFAGVLFGTFLYALAEGVGRVTRLGHGWSMTVVVVGLVAICAGGGALLAPGLAEQFGQLSQRLPEAVDQVRTTVIEYPPMKWVAEMGPGAVERALPRAATIFERITGVVWGFFGIIAAILIVVFIGIYLGAQPRPYLDGLVALVPPHRRPRVREVLLKAGESLKWWLVGRAISMVIVGTATGLGLWLLGIDLAVSLGVLAGVLDFIPNFGPIIAAVPAVLIALMESPTKAAWVIGLYLAVQTAESYLLTPLIEARVVQLKPVLVIFMQLLLGVLLGAVGLLIATPLTAVALVMIRGLYINDVLGDPCPEIRADEKGHSLFGGG